MQPNKYCPACAVETNHLRLWSKNGCQILKCSDCGLGSAVAHSFDPSSYYTEAYFDGTHRDGYANYLESEPVIRREFRHIISSLRRIIPCGKLFEIGAAYGFFLAEAKPYYEVHGVEIAEKAARFARSGDLDVQSGPVTKDIFETIGPVDVIVMLDVIEHLEKPDLVLQLCSEYLKPGGVILITTGDFGSLFAQLLGKGWRLMTPPQHLWYFTKQSVSQMARRFGLIPEKFEHPWKQVPLSLMIFQLSRMVGRKFSLDRLSLLNRVGLPVNLFDALRVTFRKPETTQADMYHNARLPTRRRCREGG
jgi:SAM-dependent methyltransferase